MQIANRDALSAFWTQITPTGVLVCVQSFLSRRCGVSGDDLPLGRAYFQAIEGLAAGLLRREEIVVLAQPGVNCIHTAALITGNTISVQVPPAICSSDYRDLNQFLISQLGVHPKKLVLVIIDGDPIYTALCLTERPFAQLATYWFTHDENGLHLADQIVPITAP